MSDTEKILEMLAAMNQRMDTMQEDLTSLRGEMATKEDLAAMATKEDLASMATKEDLSTLREEMATKEDLQQAKGDMMALMEAYFEPKFGLLADQIKLVQEKLIPVEALEETEDRLDVVEAAIKSHSAEIRKLKKAQ